MHLVRECGDVSCEVSIRRELTHMINQILDNLEMSLRGENRGYITSFHCYKPLDNPSVCLVNIRSLVNKLSKFLSFVYTFLYHLPN